MYFSQYLSKDLEEGFNLVPRIISTKDPPFLNHLEWEPLHHSYEIPRYENLTKILPLGGKKIVVSRDEEYKIKGLLTGHLENSLPLTPLMKGDTYMPIPRENIKITDFGAEYEIEYSIKLNHINSSPDGVDFEAEMNISHLKRTFNQSEKLCWLTEWFLNGTDIAYDGSISNELEKKYTRIMNKPEDPNLEHSSKLDVIFSDLNVNYSQENSESKGYLFVEFRDENNADKYFTIQSVPDIYGPSWSKNISIEYKGKWWIPTPEERKKINEIVSFLIGRQLISIGYTKYNKKGKVIEDFVNSPQISEGIHLQELCKSKFYSSPVNTLGDGTFHNLRIYFRELIPNYLALRDDLNLNEVLGKYWLSKAIPNEAEIIILSASLELLFNSWYNSKNSKSQGNFLSRKKFLEAFSEELDSIKNKLDNVNWQFPDFKKRFYNKIDNSNQMGFNASIHFFFKEIGLNIGEIEKKAIQCRNNPVHGHILKTNEVDELIKMTLAYRTLVNRTILKILGYKREYIDYYRAIDPIPVEEYIRHIDEPIQ